MRNDYCSYFYYLGFNRLFSFTIKAKINLFKKVNADILKVAVNNYAKRHKWLLKSLIYKNHEYVFIKNDLPIVIAPYKNKRIKLNAKESNYHLIYVQYKDNAIYFNISHAIIAGMSFNRVILRILHEYIDLLEGDSLKEKNDILKNEDLSPQIGDFKDIKPLTTLKKYKNVLIPIKENLFNLIFKNGISVLYEFKIEDLLKVAHSVEASPAALFTALMYLTINKVYPRNKKIIEGINMQNALLSFPKYVNYHGFVISHIYHHFDAKVKDYSLEKLCTVIRGAIFAQSDSSMDGYLIKKTLEEIEKLDQNKNYIKKALQFTLYNPTLNIRESKSTFSVSYNGKNIDERLKKYINNYFYFVDGQLIAEITSLNDKLFLSFQINKNGHKYIDAFESIMDKYNVKYLRLAKEKRFLPRMARCRYLNKK